MGRKMNEKIRKLAEQANWLFADKVTGEFTDYDKRIQKFAELLLKEAMLVCRTEWVPDSSAQKYGNQCADSIKQHFGVEE
jgi:hypothetical protein